MHNRKGIPLMTSLPVSNAYPQGKTEKIGIIFSHISNPTISQLNLCK